MFRNIDQTADNIYINLSLINASGDSTGPAVFTATYDEPILDRPSDYYGTVVKFEIPLQALPLLVLPLISIDQQDIDASTGRVTQAATAVTGSGTKFNQLMIGGTITHAGGSSVITAVQNPNMLTTATPLAVSNGTYTITYSVPDTTRFDLNSAVIGVCENTQPGSKAGAAAPIPSFTENVVFESNNAFIRQGDIRYPYVYSYEDLADLTNTALRAAWTKAGSPGGAAAFPYLSFDPLNQLFNFIMPADFVNAGANGWTICFNSLIQATVPSFSVYITNDPAFPSGRFEINTNQFQGVELGPPTPGVNVGYDRYYIGPASIFPATTYVISQDYSTLDYINSVRKIILTSNTMPIRKQYFPPPGVVNSGASNTVPIITDFQLDLNNVAGAQRSVALYEADLYRLFDFISDTPLQRIDVQILWADQNNNLYPLFLTRNDSATLKLAFLSKKLYKGDPEK